MKKELLLTAVFFFAFATIIMASNITSVKGVPGNTTGFNVTVTVNEGSPTITYVQAISDSPNEGTTKVVSFYFNATHPNGVSKIPATGASVSINRSGVTLTSDTCGVQATDGSITNMYQCNITIYYYTLPGTWTINATITDTSFNTATNTSALYTNGNTYGVAIKETTMAFNGDSGQTNIAATQNPQHINNTGNVAFSQINLTAYDLQSGSEYMSANNFRVNTTSSGGPGQQLINNTAVTLVESSIAVNNHRNFYIYLDIPEATTSGTYNSTSQWIVTMS